MRFFRHLFLLTSILVMSGMIWAAIYARKEGFTKSWRNTIEREFERRGYFVDIGKLTLGAFRGLVAEDVTFFQDVRRQQEIGRIDDVFLDVDLSQVLRKRISVRTLDVQDARLSLPLEPSNPEGRRLTVAALSGRIVISESQISIVKAEAQVAGWRLNFKGNLLRPPLDEPPRSLADDSGIIEVRQRQIAGLLAELGQFEYLGSAPQVDISFDGDLNDLSSFTMDASFHAEQVRRKMQSYLVEKIHGRLSYAGAEKLTKIQDLVIQDSHGQLVFSGSWYREKASVDFNVESNADLPSFLGMIRPDPRLGEVVFFTPPTIKAGGSLNLDDLRRWDRSKGFPGEVRGEFQSERFGTRGSVFGGLDFGYSMAGPKIYVRNLRLDHKTGVAFFNFMYDPEGGKQAIQYQTEIKLDPLVFRPFLTERGRKFLDAWEFNDLSTVYIAGVGQGSDWDVIGWETKGVIDLRHFRLKGVPFEAFEATVDTKERKKSFHQVSLERTEGKITAELAQYDLDSRLWHIEDAVSTVDHVQGASAFNARLAKSVERYRFTTPPTISLHGIIDGRRDDEVGDLPRNHDLKISFESPGNAQYTFLGKELRLSQPKGNLSVTGRRIQLHSLAAGSLGGELELQYDSKDVRSPKKPFDAQVKVRRIPLEAITRLYQGTDAIKGRIDADFSFSGDAGVVSSYHGKGKMSISEGELFALPVIGPLTNLLATAGRDKERLAHNVARDATASFQIRQGVLHTQDMEVLAPNLQLKGAGSISLVDQGIDLEVVVNQRHPLTRAVMTPISELLTFSGTGTVSKPVWKPKHLSNLMKLPTEAIHEITRIPSEGLKRIGRELFGPSPEAAAAQERKAGAPSRKPLRQGVPDALRIPDEIDRGFKGIFERKKP